MVATLADEGCQPARLAVTYRSARLLAVELTISFATVARIWRKWHLQPWRTTTFKFSSDPKLDAKIRNVVGLYLNLHDKAIVIRVNEKPQIQARPDRPDAVDAPRAVRAQVAKAYPRVKVHLVCDNYATYKDPAVKAWLARDRRITLHLTPTSGSWLNMVEIFLGSSPAWPSAAARTAPSAN